MDLTDLWCEGVKNDINYKSKHNWQFEHSKGPNNVGSVENTPILYNK